MSDDCRNCWWNEGGRCYLEPVERRPDGRSVKLAEKRCESFEVSRLRRLFRDLRGGGW